MPTGQADIYSMDATGANVFNLTHDKTIGARADVQPVWSPSGAWVAFERQYTKAGAALMVVRTDGTQLHPLLTTLVPGVWSCHPSWSKDNVIYFTSNRDGNFALYSVLPNGTGLKQLTRTSAPIQNLGPAVSPDGRFVAFSRTGLVPWGTSQLYLLEVSTGAVLQVTTNTHRRGDLDPAWAPNGKQLAFTSDRMGPSAIWMVNADGSNLVQVTHPLPTMSVGGGDVHPAFSPDGTRIAFVGSSTGATEIYTITVPTRTGLPLLTQITFDRAGKANPSWALSLPTPN